ncbi:MAG: aminotransferase class III-fold pyridoxal phosphate-dependent enzyme [Planctomycetota bacterium]|nr:aminotransferase class III-fold pyridoxal phosphate-dependent enzyme [Planctomycetota bacterium]
MNKLVAEQIASDPRIAQARQLLLETLADHVSQLDAIRPPSATRQQAFDQMLEEYGGYRGGNLYFPYLSSGAGQGPFVELADGSVKLDLITGIGVHGFGHCHPDLVSAGIDSAISDTVMQGNLQTNLQSVTLCKSILDLANRQGADYAHCFLSTSGAMANENALKIAFQKNHPANRILSFKHCFAGRTLALAQVTDKAAYRVGLPETIQVDYLPFYDAENHDQSIRSAVAHLKSHQNRHPGKHAAIWMELIQGEGGYYPGHRDFFMALINELKDQNCAIIADEVQTFSRTTEPFATQYFGLQDEVDIITIGKITQVCATIFKANYNPQPGLISQTFTGSTWAINAAQTIIDGLIKRGNFGEQGLNQKLHEHFAHHLERIGKKYPGTVSGPWGIGGMVAFTPGDGSAEIAKQMCHDLFEAGLMGFIAGGSPARIRFLLPLGAVTSEHIDLAAEVIESVASRMHPETGTAPC